MVGHNIMTFDIKWLDDKTAKYRLPWPGQGRSNAWKLIDTLKLARAQKAPTTMTTEKGNPSYRQEGIAEALGIK